MIPSDWEKVVQLEYNRVFQLDLKEDPDLLFETIEKYFKGPAPKKINFTERFLNLMNKIFKIDELTRVKVMKIIWEILCQPQGENFNKIRSCIDALHFLFLSNKDEFVVDCACRLPTFRDVAEIAVAEKDEECVLKIQEIGITIAERNVNQEWCRIVEKHDDISAFVVNEEALYQLPEEFEGRKNFCVALRKIARRDKLFSDDFEALNVGRNKSPESAKRTLTAFYIALRKDNVVVTSGSLFSFPMSEDNEFLYLIGQHDYYLQTFLFYHYFKELLRIQSPTNLTKTINETNIKIENLKPGIRSMIKNKEYEERRWHYLYGPRIEPNASDRYMDSVQWPSDRNSLLKDLTNFLERPNATRKKIHEEDVGRLFKDAVSSPEMMNLLFGSLSNPRSIDTTKNVIQLLHYLYVSSPEKFTKDCAGRLSYFRNVAEFAITKFPRNAESANHAMKLQEMGFTVLKQKAQQQWNKFGDDIREFSANPETIYQFSEKFEGCEEFCKALKLVVERHRLDSNESTALHRGAKERPDALKRVLVAFYIALLINENFEDPPAVMELLHFVRNCSYEFFFLIGQHGCHLQTLVYHIHLKLLGKKDFQNAFRSANEISVMLEQHVPDELEIWRMSRGSEEENREKFQRRNELLMQTRSAEQGEMQEMDVYGSHTKLNTTDIGERKRTQEPSSSSAPATVSAKDIPGPSDVGPSVPNKKARHFNKISPMLKANKKEKIGAKTSANGGTNIPAPTPTHVHVIGDHVAQDGVPTDDSLVGPADVEPVQVDPQPDHRDELLLVPVDVVPILDNQLEDPVAVEQIQADVYDHLPPQDAGPFDFDDVDNILLDDLEGDPEFPRPMGEVHFDDLDLDYVHVAPAVHLDLEAPVDAVHDVAPVALVPILDAQLEDLVAVEQIQADVYDHLPPQDANNIGPFDFDDIDDILLDDLVADPEVPRPMDEEHFDDLDLDNVRVAPAVNLDLEAPVDAVHDGALLALVPALGAPVQDVALAARITVGLVDTEKWFWETLDSLNHQMKVNSNGVHIHPNVHLTVAGLDETKLYKMAVHLEQVDNCFYSFNGNKWTPSTTETATEPPSEANKDPKLVWHAGGARLGEQWMDGTVEFNNVRLSSVMHTDPTKIYVQSHHKYSVVVTIHEVHPAGNLEVVKVARLKNTEFIPLVSDIKNTTVCYLKRQMGVDREELRRVYIEAMENNHRPCWIIRRKKRPVFVLVPI